MALDYTLTQTGEEVQDALDQVPVTKADLAQEVRDRETAVLAEKERAEGAEHDLSEAIGNEEEAREQAVLEEKERAEEVEQKLREMIEGGGGTPSQEIVDKINQVAADGSTLSLTMNPQLVFVGEPNNISLTAKTSENAEKIRVYHNGAIVGEGLGYELSCSQQFVMTYEGQTTYTAEFTIGGHRKTTTAKLEAVRPCYYGVGADYRAATTSMGIKKSPAGFYDMNVSVAGSRIYLVIPSTMTINRVKMSGVDMPFDAPANVVVNGTAYKAYRSTNTYDIENLTIEIQ